MRRSVPDPRIDGMHGLVRSRVTQATDLSLGWRAGLLDEKDGGLQRYAKQS